MRYKFFYSEHQKRCKEQEYIEYLRYTQMSYRERAQYHGEPLGFLFAPWIPNVGFVVGHIFGEEVLLEFTEQFDSSKDYSSIGINAATYSGCNDAELVYESDEYPKLKWISFDKIVQEVNK